MNTIRVDFEELGVSVPVYPATSANTVYAEYLEELVNPHRFALSLDRFSDKAASQLLAEAYAKTVVAGYEDFSEEEWREWFLKHPAEFHQVIFVAEHPESWVEWSNGSQ